VPRTLKDCLKDLRDGAKNIPLDPEIYNEIQRAGDVARRKNRGALTAKALTEEEVRKAAALKVTEKWLAATEKDLEAAARPPVTPTTQKTDEKQAGPGQAAPPVDRAQEAPAAQERPAGVGPKKGGKTKRQRAEDILGATVGDVVTPDSDVGYAQAGESYLVKDIADDGQVWLENTRTGSKTFWSFAELFGARRRKVVFAATGPSPAAPPVEEPGPVTSKFGEDMKAKAEAARKRMAERRKARGEGGLEVLYSGLPAEVLEDIKDASVIAASWFVNRALSFSEFTVRAVSEFGDWVRPHLTEIYDRAMRDFFDRTADASASPKPGSVPVEARKPFAESSVKRALRAVWRGTPVPKDFRLAQEELLGEQRFMEERLRLLVDGTRKRIKKAFPGKADRERVHGQLEAYWLGDIPISEVEGGPAVQRLAEEFRQGLDHLTLTAVNNGLVPDTQVTTWLENTGEWMRRTFLAFDPTADWNYDKLLKRKNKGDEEITRIWDNMENLLREENPEASDAEIEAAMRRLVDRREAQSILDGNQPGQSGAGFTIDTGSLLHRKDLPSEVLEWMGQIRDPFTRALQSTKWISQFLARNMLQQRLADIGLEAGWFSEKPEGRNHVQLYPNTTELVPELDEEGKVVKTDEGKVAADYVTRIDRRHAPLHGLYTSPEMKAALDGFDGMMNTGISAVSRLTEWVPRTFIKLVGFWKLGKVALNPISYPVNSIGGVVMRLMTGAVNPIKFTRAFIAVATRNKVIDAKSALRMQRARARYLLAVEGGVMGKGVLTSEIDASSGRQYEPGGLRRSLKAVKDIVSGKGGTGAVTRLGRAVMDMLKTPGEYGIRFFDDMCRTHAFLDEMELSYKANEGFSRRQHIEWAADRAENIYQTYDRLPQAVRDLSNMGILQPFISFKIELLRNAAWTVYYGFKGIRSDNPALRADGARKLVGFSVMAAMPSLVALLSRLRNVDDEEEEAKKKTRAFQRWYAPPWDKGEEIVIKEFGADEVQYIPLSYLMPTSEVMRLPTQIARLKDSVNPGNDINQVVEGVFADTMGGGPLWTVMEGVSNTRLGRGELTSAEGTRGFGQRMGYMAEQMQPGATKLLNEAYKAQTGTQGYGGREYSLEEIGMKMAGLRIRTVKPKDTIPYVLREFDRRWRSASAEVSRQKKRTPGDVKAIVKAEEYRDEKHADLRTEFKQFLSDTRDTFDLPSGAVFQEGKKKGVSLSKGLREVAD